jgi:hypothetical protein
MLRELKNLYVYVSLTDRSATSRHKQASTLFEKVKKYRTSRKLILGRNEEEVPGGRTKCTQRRFMILTSPKISLGPSNHGG